MRVKRDFSDFKVDGDVELDEEEKEKEKELLAS